MNDSSTQYIIRNERLEDRREVEELTRRAFWNLNTPGCTEHYLAHRLRTHPDFIPELDLVLEKDGRIIGSIMYTRARLIGNGCEKEILTFGPVSILPEYQRQGLGKALLAGSFAKARDAGYEAIVIFGHPGNYVSSGFVSCRRHNVHLDGGIFPTAMLVLELKSGALAGGGDWIYRESSAYDINEAEADEYDKLFPPAAKEYRPSQEEFYIYSHSLLG